MIKELKQQRRWNMTVLLVIMSMLCLALSLLRCFITGTGVFLFLNWNLFLAFLPWLFTTMYMIRPQLHGRKWILLSVVCCWLLFFPNAPYILTDLFHLRLKLMMPVWYDLVLIIAYAWTGLLFGFVSLLDIEEMLEKYLSRRFVTIFSVFILFLSSFGIYLGRYLRWNSWDIVREPLILLSDIGDRLINPLAHPNTWGMTLFMGLLLNMIFWSLKAIRAKK